MCSQVGIRVPKFDANLGFALEAQGLFSEIGSPGRGTEIGRAIGQERGSGDRAGERRKYVQCLVFRNKIERQRNGKTQNERTRKTKRRKRVREE